MLAEYSEVAIIERYGQAGAVPREGIVAVLIQHPGHHVHIQPLYLVDPQQIANRRSKYIYGLKTGKEKDFMAA